MISAVTQSRSLSSHIELLIIVDIFDSFTTKKIATTWFVISLEKNVCWLSLLIQFTATVLLSMGVHMLMCTSCPGDFSQIATCQQNRILRIKATYLSNMSQSWQKPSPIHQKFQPWMFLESEILKQWRLVFQPQHAGQLNVHKCICKYFLYY